MECSKGIYPMNVMVSDVKRRLDRLISCGEKVAFKRIVAGSFSMRSRVSGMVMVCSGLYS